MSGPLSISELILEVEDLEHALTTSDRDRVSLQAEFVHRLAALEARSPDLTHVDAELDRLTAEAVTLAFGATTEQAASLIRDLAELRGPLARLNALGDLVTDAASRIAGQNGS